MFKDIQETNGKTTSLNPAIVAEVKQTRDADFLHEVTFGLAGKGAESTITTTTGTSYVVPGTVGEVKANLSE